MGHDKRATNEYRHPYIVQLPVDRAGFEFKLNRRIQAFHKLRGIEPRYGRSITEGDQIYCRWCFSDLATARAFVEQFGSVLQNNRLLKQRQSAASRCAT
jgi:hypothetical protein